MVFLRNIGEKLIYCLENGRIGKFRMRNNDINYIEMYECIRNELKEWLWELFNEEN